MQTGGESVQGLEEAERPHVDELETQVETPEETVDEQIDEAPENETVRETTERIFKQLSKKNEGERDKDVTDPEKSPDQEKQETGNGLEKEPLPEEFDPDLEPPARFNARAKQLFNNLPKGLKREVNRTVRDLESAGTRERQQEKMQLEQERQAVSAIHAAVAPYLPKWQRPAAQAIAELAAAHEKLTNPETSVSEYLKLGQHLGIDVSPLQARYASNEKNPTNNHLESIVRTTNELQEWKRNLEQQQIDQEASRIISEIEIVQQERDPASGRLVYPELQDEEFFQRAKPLISAMVRTVPGLSYGDAARRAALTMRGSTSPVTSTPIQRTSLPAAESTRAPSAALSVRSRSAPAVGTQSTTEPPPDALRDVRSTTEWVYEQLRQGKRI